MVTLFPEAPVVGLHEIVPVQFFASKTAISPKQIVTSATLIVGFGLTVTVPVAEASQLPLLVQVAVYVVVPTGLTESVVPVTPVFQVTVPVQPVVLNTAVSPPQIVTELTEIVNFGFTVKVSFAASLLQEPTHAA